MDESSGAPPQRILVIDDDRAFLSLASRMLESAGFEVVTAADGQQGLERAESQPPSLVIVDGLLPRMSGEKVCERLRASEAGAHVPIIFLSAFTALSRNFKFYTRLTTDLGVALVLHKPLPADALVEHVRQVLFQQRASALVTPEEEDQARELLLELGREFVGDARQRIEGFGQMVQVLRAEPSDIDTLGRLRQEAHKLAGSAGTYGFADMGEASRYLEQLAEEALSARGFHVGPGSSDGPGLGVPRPLEENLLVALTATVGKLRELVDAALADAISRSEQRLPAIELRPDGEAITRVIVVDPQGDAVTPVRSGNPEGIRVHNVVSRSEALEAVASLGPHVVFIDGAASDADGNSGFSTCRAIKGSAKGADLPVVLMVSQGAFEDRVEAIRSGADGLAIRPLASDHLCERAESLRRERAASRHRALVVDDDPTVIKLVERVLEQGGISVDGCTQPAEVLDRISEHRPDILLLDVEMPHFSGYDLCRVIRADRETRTLPIVFLSAHTELNDRVNAFRAGADDYIPKPFAAEELVARVHSHLDRQSLMVDLASKDSLTELYNRSALIERLESLLANASRYGRRFAVLKVDIDNLSGINQELGLNAGDQVLAGLGRRLRHGFRRGDVTARVGDDEFVVVLEAVTQREAMHVAGKLLEDIRERPFLVGAGKRISPKLSVGVATYPGDGEDVQALLSASDRALRKAAQEGGDRAATASQSPRVLIAAAKRDGVNEVMAALESRGYFVDWSEDSERILHKLSVRDQAAPLEMALVEAELAAPDGRDLMELIHTGNVAISVPILWAMAPQRYEAAAREMHPEAIGLLVKPLRPREVLARLLGHVN